MTITDLNTLPFGIQKIVKEKSSLEKYFEITTVGFVENNSHIQTYRMYFGDQLYAQFITIYCELTKDIINGIKIKISSSHRILLKKNRHPTIRELEGVKIRIMSILLTKIIET